MVIAMKTLLNYTKLTLTAHIKSLGYPLHPFMLVGVRSKADKPDSFDDKFYLITPKEFHGFDCTTNPGVSWLMKFMNPKGTAVLKQGWYWYKLGKHKDYEALVQAAAVTVYRDSNKDTKSDEIAGTEETGFYGINIHRSLPDRLAKSVGLFSAGCTVIHNPADFKLLIDTCKSSGLKQFPYYLITEF
jgi:hypothetical protein